MLNTEQIVSADKILTVDPKTIIVKDELPRIRKELGKIQDLAASLATFGQLQPIVVNRKMELLAGGRRLAACLLTKRDVKICFVDEVEPLRMREIELEENIQRKSLTPAEEVLAVAELHQLKTALHKELSVENLEKGQRKEWRQEDTAELLGKSRTSVIEDLLLAEAVKHFPSLSTAKTKSEIRSAVKGLNRITQNMEALSKYEDTIKRTKEFVLVNRDAVEHMQGIPDKSVDLLLTDPPYGIDVDKNAMTLGGKTGGENTTTGISYNDTAEYALNLCGVLAKESYRFCKPTSHAFVFCAPSNFYAIKEMFNLAGWNCAERPVIWIKRASGQNNCPERWFSSAYEMILYARREESSLLIQGKPDWIQCDPVNPSERIHQAEKPLPLLKELISRVALPGSYIYDPFAGSGATIEAAVEMKMLALGCELAMESYVNMLARMTKWLENRK